MKVEKSQSVVKRIFSVSKQSSFSYIQPRFVINVTHTHQLIFKKKSFLYFCVPFETFFKGRSEIDAMRNSSPRDQKKIGTGNYYYILSTFLLPSFNSETHYSDCYYLSVFPLFSYFSALIILYYRLSLFLQRPGIYTHTLGRFRGFFMRSSSVIFLFSIQYAYIFLSLSPLRVQINGRRSFPITFWPRNLQLYIFFYTYFLKKRRRIMISDSRGPCCKCQRFITLHTYTHCVQVKNEKK